MSFNNKEPEQMMLPYKDEEVPELLTIKQAAKRLNLQYRQLLEAVNEGLVPTYRLRRGRKLVSPAEIFKIMQSTSSDNQEN